MQGEDAMQGEEAAQGTRKPATLTCAEAVVLLPWLLNGSLEADEERALRGHLAGCAPCGGEFVETVEAWKLMDAHIPSLALVQYAHGLPAQGLSRERIERHLALCTRCREDVGLAASGAVVVDFPSELTGRSAEGGRRRSGTGWRDSRWRHWALAASLATMVGTGALLWSLTARPEGPAPGSTADATVVFATGFEDFANSGWSEVVGQKIAKSAAEP